MKKANKSAQSAQNPQDVILTDTSEETTTATPETAKSEDTPLELITDETDLIKTMEDSKAAIVKKARKQATQTTPEPETLALDLSIKEAGEVSAEATAEPEPTPVQTDENGKPKKRRLTRPELRARKEALERAKANGSAEAAKPVKQARTAPQPVTQSAQDEPVKTAEPEKQSVSLASAFPSGGLVTILDKFMSVVTACD